MFAQAIVRRPESPHTAAGSEEAKIYRFTPITAAHAEAILRWRHPAPYAVYDFGPDDAAILLAPELNYFAALDAAGGLAGFACFGDDAQVIGGCYDDRALDVGLSLAPERAGRGAGTAFLRHVCAFAATHFAARALRLSVSCFNRRAITVYRRGGFVPQALFQGTTRHGVGPFMIMTRAGLVGEAPQGACREGRSPHMLRCNTES